MNETATQTSNAEAPKTPTPPREIIRGRMPVTVVYLARFGKKSGESTKAKAEAFGTTVGKIDDIVKNRNFAYVQADFRPTATQKAEAKAWLERHPTGAADLLAELEALPEASTEEAAAFEKVRSESRGQSPTTASGETADAGGGNRRGKGKGKSASEVPAPDAATTGESLLT